MLYVGGRIQNSNVKYTAVHPAILHNTHPLKRLIIWFEHLLLLHAGITLVGFSLGHRFHGSKKKRAVQTVVRHWLTCHCYAARPKPIVMGHLSEECVTPGHIFDRVGVAYADPLFNKHGHVCLGQQEPVHNFSIWTMNSKNISYTHTGSGIVIHTCTVHICRIEAADTTVVASVLLVAIQFSLKTLRHFELLETG